MSPRPLSDDDEPVEYSDDEHNPGDDLFDDPQQGDEDPENDYLDLDDEFDSEDPEEFPLRDKAARKRWKNPDL